MWWVAAAAAQDVIELPEEDVLASLRLRAMGGAITGLAESASANLYNPAALGVRRPLAPQRPFDPDTALQARDHPLVTELFSLFGTEPGAPYRSSYFQLAANVRVARLGFTGHWRETRVVLADDEVGSFLASPGISYSGDTLVVGALPQIFGMQAENRGMRAAPALTVGTLWCPRGTGLRVGARARTPAQTPELGGEGIQSVRLPAEASLGASYGVGLTNTPGVYGPDRERSDAPVVGLVSVDLVWTGDSGGAVVIGEGIGPAGTSGATVTARAGTELWTVRDHLRWRLGGGWLPGRGAVEVDPYVSWGLAGEVIHDPRGFGWRLVVGGEIYASGPAVGVGLETW